MHSCIQDWFINQAVFHWQYMRIVHVKPFNINHTTLFLAGRLTALIAIET